MGHSAYQAELDASCPDGWKVVPLTDVVFFQEGPGILAKDFHGAGVPLIRLKGVEGDYVTKAGCNYLNPDRVAAKWNHFKLDVGDLVISTSASFGRVSVVTEVTAGAIIYTGLIRFRPTTSALDPSFLRAFLSSQTFLQQVEAMASGSVIRHFGPMHLKQMAIQLPPLSEQVAIGAISDAFAERLRSLRQTNTTLEAIAQALFKSWFVDFDPVHAKAEGSEPEAMDAAAAALFPSKFEASELGLIPKGWRAGRLVDISSNPRDQAKPDKIDPDIPYFGLEHMPRKSIALSDHGTAEGLGSSKFWFEESDILFGKLRPYFHKVGLAPFNGICSTDILVLRPLKLAFHALLLTHASSDALIDFATRLSNGAKMPRSSWKDIASYPICIPSDFVAQAFNEAVNPLVERIKENVRASSTLTQLRDTLLPRLISGKLRLPDAEAAIEETLV